MAIDQDSINQNLNKWCFEVGSVFEPHTTENAKRFREYINSKTVVDLGSGDGAANKAFEGLTITAVDINPSKLEKNTAQKKIQKDFITYLEEVESVTNVFMHHSLEHYSDPQKVLELLGKKLKGHVFVAVPARDGVHSVHHSNFDSPEEIRVPGVTELVLEESKHGSETEFIFIGVKE